MALPVLCTMVRSSSSVDYRLMLKDNLAEPGTITSSVPKFGKRTVNSWFSSIVLGLKFPLLNFSIACMDLVRV